MKRTKHRCVKAARGDTWKSSVGYCGGEGSAWVSGLQRCEEKKRSLAEEGEMNGEVLHL